MVGCFPQPHACQCIACVKLIPDRRTQCEARVLQFLEEQNKPFNSQSVVDHLACEGFKKSQVNKALDSLAEAKKITYKVVVRTGRSVALFNILCGDWSRTVHIRSQNRDMLVQEFGKTAKIYVALQTNKSVPSPEVRYGNMLTRGAQQSDLLADQAAHIKLGRSYPRRRSGSASSIRSCRQSRLGWRHARLASSRPQLSRSFSVCVAMGASTAAG